MTDSGSMRQVIRIQAQTTVQDSTGQANLVWGDIAKRRAEKLATPGTESVSGGERSARVPTVFKIRYPKEVVISPKHRVVHREGDQDRVYQVLSTPDPDGRRVDMLLICDELVGEVAT